MLSKGANAAARGQEEGANYQDDVKSGSEQGATPAVAPEERTLANPGATLGPNVSVTENPGSAKKILQGLILPTD